MTVFDKIALFLIGAALANLVFHVDASIISLFSLAIISFLFRFVPIVD